MGDGPTSPTRNVSVSLEWPAEPFPGAYANIVAVTHTPWDFVLQFGYAVPPAAAANGSVDSATLQIRPISLLSLSPLAAKQLHELLAEQIRLYSAASETEGSAQGPEEPGGTQSDT